MKKSWWGLSILLMIGLLVLFQNCAGNMQATGLPSSEFQQSTESTLVPSTQSSPFRTNLTDDKAALNEPIQVSVDAKRLPQGSTLLWDHVLGDGQTYCRQTSSLDKLNLTLSCPQVGALRISLYLTEPDGSESTLTMEVTVVESKPTSPTPTPTSTPAVLNGGALYTQHCSGCHGSLATSSKRQISLSRLNSAITSVSSMTGLASLSTAKRQAIVTALQ